MLGVNAEKPVEPVPGDMITGCFLPYVNAGGR